MWLCSIRIHWRSPRWSVFVTKSGVDREFDFLFIRALLLHSFVKLGSEWEVLLSTNFYAPPSFSYSIVVSQSIRSVCRPNTFATSPDFIQRGVMSTTHVGFFSFLELDEVLLLLYILFRSIHNPKLLVVITSSSSRAASKRQIAQSSFFKSMEPPDREANVVNGRSKQWHAHGARASAGAVREDGNYYSWSG